MASKPVLQRLLSCMNLGIKHKFTLLVETRRDFYEPQQQHKQSKSMAVKKAGLDMVREIYINSILHPLTNFRSNSRSIKIKHIFSHIDDHEKPHSFASDGKSAMV